MLMRMYRPTINLCIYPGIEVPLMCNEHSKQLVSSRQVPVVVPFFSTRQGKTWIR